MSDLERVYKDVQAEEIVQTHVHGFTFITKYDELYLTNLLEMINQLHSIDLLQKYHKYIREAVQEDWLLALQDIEEFERQNEEERTY